MKDWLRADSSFAARRLATLGSILNVKILFRSGEWFSVALVGRPTTQPNSTQALRGREASTKSAPARSIVRQAGALSGRAIRKRGTGICPHERAVRIVGLKICHGNRRKILESLHEPEILSSSCESRKITSHSSRRLLRLQVSATPKCSQKAQIETHRTEP